MLDSILPQSEDVFTPDTYRGLLAQLRKVNEERTRLHQAIQQHQPKVRQHSAEWKQYDEKSAHFRQLVQEYLRRLPSHVIARCPYCGERVIQPFDHLSLCGFDATLKATRVFQGNLEWRQSSALQISCSHVICSTFAVDLNGVQPDDVTGWLPGNRTQRLHRTPHVIVWPLVARHTSAVLTALPVGRLNDTAPIHHYTAYIMTYFAADDTNLHSQEFWVPNDLGGPATAAVWADFNLNRWIEAQRLWWIGPDEPSRITRGSVEQFPYRTATQPGWYHILNNGQVDGPHPYLATWDGKAPQHDESYAKTVESR